MMLQYTSPVFALKCYFQGDTPARHGGDEESSHTDSPASISDDIEHKERRFGVIVIVQ
jgi:hypothetical protein